MDRNIPEGNQAVAPLLGIDPRICNRAGLEMTAILVRRIGEDDFGVDTSQDRIVRCADCERTTRHDHQLVQPERSVSVSLKVKATENLDRIQFDMTVDVVIDIDTMRNAHRCVRSRNSPFAPYARIRPVATPQRHKLSVGGKSGNHVVVRHHSMLRDFDALRTGMASQQHSVLQIFNNRASMATLGPVLSDRPLSKHGETLFDKG